MRTDFELLDRWATGDDRAARELIERHFDAVYRFFRNKVADGVDDLVQDTFATCVRNRDRFRREASFRSYLLGTARNKLLHYYRDRRQVDDLSEIGESRLVDLDPSPSSALVKKREARILLEALRQLSLDQQIVIELYCWEGLSGPEVARVLEIGEAAMRSRLHRAKALLAQQIEALSDSAELLESTLGDLEGWAAAIRGQY